MRKHWLAFLISVISTINLHAQENENKPNVLYKVVTNDGSYIYAYLINESSDSLTFNNSSFGLFSINKSNIEYFRETTYPRTLDEDVMRMYQNEYILTESAIRSKNTSFYLSDYNFFNGKIDYCYKGRISFELGTILGIPYDEIYDRIGIKLYFPVSSKINLALRHAHYGIFKEGNSSKITNAIFTYGNENLNFSTAFNRLDNGEEDFYTYLDQRVSYYFSFSSGVRISKYIGFAFESMFLDSTLYFLNMNLAFYHPYMSLKLGLVSQIMNEDRDVRINGFPSLGANIIVFK